MKKIIAIISSLAFVVILYSSFTFKPLAAYKVYKDSVVTNFFKRSNGWISSDGGLTVQLANGSNLWLMGDSHIDDYDSASGTIPCLFQVRNAALLQLKDDWNWRNTKTLTGNSTGIKSYLKNNADDKYFMWPGAGIQLKDTVYVYCGSLKNEGSGCIWFCSCRQ